MPESQETSDYPGALDTWVTIDNKEDLVEQSDINKIKAAILAVQTELGTDPAGTLATLKARLAIMMATNGAVAQGTSFPVSPAPVDGQLFYRTDSGETYQYVDDEWLLLANSLIRFFSESGSTVVPSSSSFAVVFMCGAGGGAGNSVHNNTNYNGGGGAGAESILGNILPVTPGSTLTITVGVGGVGGANGIGNNDGTAGGASSITGGGYTLSCAGGPGGTNGFNNPGVGGTGPDGTIDDNVLTSLKLSMTGSGQTAKSRISYPGGNGVNGPTTGGGCGGGSMFGEGGNGSTTSTAQAGKGPGAGGGANRGSSSTTNNGMDGYNGIVVLLFG